VDQVVVVQLVLVYQVVVEHMVLGKYILTKENSLQEVPHILFVLEELQDVVVTDVVMVEQVVDSVVAQVMSKVQVFLISVHMVVTMVV
jgi:hypothetical protein